MASIANITVKAQDGVTDVIYVAKAGSAGDKNPALWQQDAYGTSVSLRPTFQMSTQWNGPKTARRAEFVFVYPQLVTDSTTGVTSVKSRGHFAGSFVLPVDMTDTNISNTVAQLANLLKSTLIQDSAKSGYAPV